MSTRGPDFGPLVGEGHPRYGRRMDFRTESVVDLAAQVRSGTRTAAELVDHALGAIASHNPTINAFVAVDEARALSLIHI